jgi:Periplasmic binding protein
MPIGRRHLAFNYPNSLSGDVRIRISVQRRGGSDDKRAILVGLLATDLILASAQAFAAGQYGQWQDTPEYKEWLAWMRKYNTSGNVSDAFTVYGYSAAQTMVAVLKQCGDNLTRENVMKQAASIHYLKLPMLLPGITASTSADDFAPIKQMQLTKFDGNNWVTFGELISAVGN